MHAAEAVASCNERSSPESNRLEGNVTDARVRIEADAALRESEERYRSLFAAHPHPMWFFDAETLAFLEVNDAAVAHYGFQRDEFLSMTIADIRPPEDVGRLGRRSAGSAEGAIDEAGVWRHRKKDGSIILVEITSHAAEYNGRRAEVVLAHDITDRMNAEAALRESEERFRAMFDVAPMGIAQADPATGRWVAVNPRMCLITGYSAEELLTMTVPELTHPEDRDRDWLLFQKVVKGEAPEYRLEKRYLRKDGSIAWVNVNMVVLRDAAGRPTRTLAMIEDITERKKAAEALVASESRYRVLFENAAEGIVAIDPETRRPLFHNPAVCAMFGYSSEEFGQREVSDLHPKEALATIFAGITSAGRGERPGTEVVPCIRKDGSTFQADIRGSVVELEGRKVVFGFFTDVTQRVREEPEDDFPPFELDHASRECRPEKSTVVADARDDFGPGRSPRPADVMRRKWSRGLPSDAGAGRTLGGVPEHREPPGLEQGPARLGVDRPRSSAAFSKRTRYRNSGATEPSAAFLRAVMSSISARVRVGRPAASRRTTFTHAIEPSFLR